MFQIIDRPGIDTILMNQCIGGDIPLAHGFPQWRIVYHFCSLPSL